MTMRSGCRSAFIGVGSWLSPTGTESARSGPAGAKKVSKVRREERKKEGTGTTSMAGERKKDIRHFRDLEVYQRAFAAAMEIFELTQASPADEKYSMVDQISP